ncbi:LLM class flavin-dependent oxidoreductase [Streptomyces sp. NPDC090106]|uniref:LLM class flavin-dependent oxidoreductase n=1 Tax=Streptomyces sp. NPDC090106 TaxID=3365946 RepID=UPI00380222FF
MRAVKIGIGLPNQIRDVRPDVVPAWARNAEEAGFSSLGSLGRIAYPGVMDTVALAAAAGATQRIGLISTLLLAPVWPPVLLAKEVAGIDAVSGGRLTLGLGLGGRADDFVVDGLGPRGTGKRLDQDIETYRSVWRGEIPPGCDNPAVPEGTREVPLLFGGMAQVSFDRVARAGQGYIGPSAAPGLIAPLFDRARAAWQEAGRAGAPHLVALAYYALGDEERGRANVHDYYLPAGPEGARARAAEVSGGADAVRTTVKAYEELGVDELILIPTVDDLDEVARLADVVL